MKLFGRNIGRKYILGAMVFILALGLVGCSSGGKEVVGKVNNEVITKDELYDILVGQNGAQMVDALIAEKLVALESKKQKIEVKDEDIQAELDSMIEEVGGEAMFTQWLTYNGMTKEEAKENIKTNLTIKYLVKDKISISDDDIKEYFDENKAKFGQEEELKASHILVKELDLAEEIHEKLKNGEDFEELAKEHSVDGSAQFGGDLGFFPRGEMVKPFEEAAFALDMGEISEIVESEFGYHIIKAYEKKEAKEANLEENRDKILKILEDQEVGNAYKEWYQEVIQDYTIVNNLKK